MAFTRASNILAMEYFPCGDLKARLQNPLTADEAIAFLKEIARSLKVVHEAGIIHRDLKPPNVMLRDDGSVVLIDFGLARSLLSGDGSTRTGVLRGSPYYMSPEQAQGEALDARTDIYSLGVILYEMLAGKKPYLGASAIDVLQQHVMAPVPELPVHHMSYQPLLERLMSKSREQRIASCDELLDGARTDVARHGRQRHHRSGDAGVSRRRHLRRPMDILNFPIVALGAALICLIGVTLYAITQRSSLRSRDEQLVVARAQAYAMLELSQAGVLFLDREHKLMGEASAAAPELLGHTCGAGTAFVQVIAELVDVTVRREAVEYLETMWKAEPTAQVDATQNPLARIHSGARHLAHALLAPGGRRPRASHHRVYRAHRRTAASCRTPSKCRRSTRIRSPNVSRARPARGPR